MFCDKENVNILSALLPQMGVTDVVVCPGSRNGAIVHNLYEMSKKSEKESNGNFRIHSVTDERCAAFVALGISLSENKRPVGVCVTSGSALLNTIPAVSEAFYQQVPLLIISGDRPQYMIGQLDGQTIYQNNALSPYANTYFLPEPKNKIEEHWCRNIICESFINLKSEGGKPTHINVPISEPLFSFTTPKLPDVTLVDYYECETNFFPNEIIDEINKSSLPVLLIGQFNNQVDELLKLDNNNQLLVLPELVSNQRNSYRTAMFENDNELIQQIHPDLVIHVGGNLVNKQLKTALRIQRGISVIRIQENEGMPDTFGHLAILLRARWERVIPKLISVLRSNDKVAQAKEKINESYDRSLASFLNSTYKSGILKNQVLYCLQQIAKHKDDIQLATMFAIKFYLQSKKLPIHAIHLANSTVVRTATKVFDDTKYKIFVNRGVNGIEGSLSTAVGCSLVSSDLNLVFIGDLSFFYDSNGLWNTEVHNNLRIVLFNNSGGKIFERLSGLEKSQARDEYISGGHHASAFGIASSYSVSYLRANSLSEISENIPKLFETTCKSAVLLEIFC